MSRKAHKTLSAAGRKKARAPIDQPEPLQRKVDNVDALSDSEERFRAVFENAAVGIARVGPDGRWLEVNQRLCDIVGYSREELMAKTFADITHPDDLGQDAKAVRRMLAGEIDTCSMEKRYFRKGGSVVWVNLTFSMTRKTDGSPDYFISIVEDITARKQAEEKLHDQEERLQLASSAAGLGVFEWNVRLNRIFWGNDRMYEIFGLTRADGAIQLKPFTERYLHPDDAAKFEQALKDGMKSGRPFRLFYRIYRKDGEMRWLALAGHFELDSEGAPVRMNGILLDITENKIAEEAKLKRVALRADVVSALAEHGQPLQNMLQKTAEAMVRHLDAAFARIWTLNPEDSMLELQASAGMYTRLNGKYSRIRAGEFKIGLIASERKPHLTNDVLNDPRISDPEWARENGMTAFAGYPLQVEDRIVGVMGMFARRPLTEDTIDAITNIAAPVAQAIERKRAEVSQRESRDRLAGIVSSAMDAIITVDENQLIVLFNAAAEGMFGCAASEALGQPLDRFIPERFRRSHAEDVRRFGETGGTSQAMGRLGALVALRADGSEFPIEASISAIEVGGRKLYTVIHRDITERKRAEVEREQLAREQVARATAEAANCSKDEFLALVSHELRSPLNAILGYARMLRAHSLDKAAADNAAAAVERCAKAQLQIIEDLLDSARIVTGKLRIEPGPVDLASEIEAALDTVRPAAEAKGVTLTADFGPAPVEVLGDSMRLQQVVWNLLSNSIKFTPEGGRVELRMEGGDDDVRIIISDTGKGIEPEFLPFVFDRFRQADTSGSRRRGGLGLGLSLAKHLVELHGGTIAAASDGAGRGATFTVTLPRRHPAFVAPPAVAPAEGAVAPRADLSLEGVTVLAVDDQEEARVILSQTLIEYGARVTAVSSGAEALALLSDPSGGKLPDVLILNIAMPEEDGFTVLKKARELEAAQGAGTRIPAVALTSHGRSEDRLRALQAGFQTHIVKPVEPAELALVIASLTGRNVGPP
jgi:PAS domain S-box-containing protein